MMGDWAGGRVSCRAGVGSSFREKKKRRAEITCLGLRSLFFSCTYTIILSSTELIVWRAIVKRKSLCSTRLPTTYNDDGREGGLDGDYKQTHTGSHSYTICLVFCVDGWRWKDSKRRVLIVARPTSVSWVQRGRQQLQQLQQLLPTRPDSALLCFREDLSSSSKLIIWFR